MAEKIPMLALSPTMDKGTIVSWHKKEGETVASGDVLCEVETDKATMDYESTQEGTLLKILCHEGDSAEVGEAIGIIGEEGESIPVDEKKEESASPPAAIEASTNSGEPKKSAEKKTAKEEDPVPSSPPSRHFPSSNENKKQTGTRVFASPLAKRMAEQHGLDIGKVSGSGPSGRVLKRDIEGVRRNPDSFRPENRALESSLSGTAQSVPADRIIPLSSIRKTIAQRLSGSKFSAPHFYLGVDVRGEALITARNELNATLKDTKVSMNAFLVKFVSEALARFPGINAGWKGDAIVEYGSVDIALAVAVTDGLITPIVRNCAGKTVSRIDSELSALVDRARSGKLAPEEYTGAGFTISNLGSFGIDEFTAIINPPGSAILAVGALKDAPVTGPEGIIEAGKVMKLTLSCDHRVIDGAAGAEFLAALKGFIENPVRMII